MALTSLALLHWGGEEPFGNPTKHGHFSHSQSEARGAPILLRKSNGVIHNSQDNWIF